MTQGSKPRGRPPIGDEAMQQITLRVPRIIVENADLAVERRLDGADRSQVLREWLAAGYKKNLNDSAQRQEGRKR